jgi:hypothetical protein
MEQSSDEMIVYRLGHRFEMKLAAAQPSRDWMQRSKQSFANRCLPMRIANQAGWEILNDRALKATWLGGSSPNALLIDHTGDPPYAAISHFGEGVLTFTIPFLFRTRPGVVLLFRGPANSPKDSIAPLEGLVETDWAMATASVNWKFTRTNTWVEFAEGEPICMIVPLRLDLLEKMQPRLADIEDDPETNRKYQAWRASTDDFNQRLRKRDQDAVRLGWQRYYFRGSAPHACSGPLPEAREHRTRLDLRNPGEQKQDGHRSVDGS